jgi:hypothetical protein
LFIKVRYGAAKYRSSSDTSVGYGLRFFILPDTRSDKKCLTLSKRIDLSVYSQAKLNAVARRLNERPRKTLNFDTPVERFQQIVASTG